MRVLPFALAMVLGAVNFSAEASLIGVVDSGVDFKHPNLSKHAWVNPGEIPNNGLDDEQDGYIDDLNGWNFVENNGLLLDPKYLNTFPPETPRFFEIQKRLLEGTASDEHTLRESQPEKILNPISWESK